VNVLFWTLFLFRFWRLRCPSRRETSSGSSSSSSSSSFGHKELKVGREYRVNVFNKFINAWFDYWFWQVSISYDYAVLRMIKEIFLVFCITIFSEKAQNKIKHGGIKTTFYWWCQFIKQKALHKFAFVSGGTKGFLKSIKEANKHHLNNWAVEGTPITTQGWLNNPHVKTRYLLSLD